MLNWQILLTESSPGTYEMRVRYPGAPRGGHRFVRALPPDFSDFVRQDSNAVSKRVWRRPPGDKVDDGLLFCAASLDTLKDIGARLHDALFRLQAEDAPRDLTGEFLTLRETAAKLESDFRLDINLTDAPQLARVPWEALYFADDDLFLGIDTKTNIVRTMTPGLPGPLPAPIEPPIRMLVAVANPLGDIEAGAEVADIKRRLSDLLDESCTRYEVQTLPQATRSQLGSRVEDWKPHIVHFIGHGGFDDDKGLIYLHDERDPQKRDPIDSATLRDFVRNDRPWLVVLNSCLSGAAARAEPFGGAAQNLLRVNVPFVVAMQSPISDQAAIRFSQRFYASLMRGDPVAIAVTRGRNAIKGMGEESLRAELITPVLYMTGEAERLAIVESMAAKPGPRVSLDRILAIVATGGTVVAAVFAYLQLQMSAPPHSPPPARMEAAGRAAPGPVARQGREAVRGAAVRVTTERAAPASASRARPARSSALGPESESNAFAMASGTSWRWRQMTQALQAEAPPADLNDRSPGFAAPPQGSPAPQVPRAQYGTPRSVTPPPPTAQTGSEELASVSPTGERERSRVLHDLVPDSGIAGSIAGAVAGGLLGRLLSRPDSPSRYGALTRRGPTLDAWTMAELDLAALKARNGAEIVFPEPMRSTAERRYRIGARRGEPGEISSQRTRSVETYLLSRGVPRESLKYGAARSFSDPRNYGYVGLGGPYEGPSDPADFTLRYPSSLQGRPVSVLASFPAGSSAPLAVDLAGFIKALSSPSAPALAVELVGRADAVEAVSAGGNLAGQRADRVAQLIRAQGIAGDRIRVSAGNSSAEDASPSNPVLERRVDGRLVVQGAERIGFAENSAKIPLNAASLLDRLATLLEGNAGLRLHLAPGQDAAADPKAGKRLARVRKQLIRRGVDEDRVEIAAARDEPAAGSPPEAPAPSVEVTVIASPDQPRPGR